MKQKGKMYELPPSPSDFIRDLSADGYTVFNAAAEFLGGLPGGIYDTKVDGGPLVGRLFRDGTSVGGALVFTDKPASSRLEDFLKKYEQ